MCKLKIAQKNKEVGEFWETGPVHSLVARPRGSGGLEQRSAVIVHAPIVVIPDKW